MKQWLVLLMLFLVACAQAPTTPSTPPPSSPEYSSSDVPTKEEPPSGVSSTIGGTTGSSGEGIQPTGTTRNLVMAVTSSGFDPNILTVIPGDRIKLTISNDDTKDHSFILAEFNVNVVIAAGATSVADFTPLQKGEFAWKEKDGSKAGTLIVGGKT